MKNIFYATRTAANMNYNHTIPAWLGWHLQVLKSIFIFIILSSAFRVFSSYLVGLQVVSKDHCIVCALDIVNAHAFIRIPAVDSCTALLNFFAV